MRGPAQYRRRTGRVGETQLATRLVQQPNPEQELAEMKAHALGARKAGRERAEPGERERRLRLREEADRGGDLALGVVRREPRGRRELVLC